MCLQLQLQLQPLATRKGGKPQELGTSDEQARGIRTTEERCAICFLRPSAKSQKLAPASGRLRLCRTPPPAAGSASYELPERGQRPFCFGGQGRGRAPRGADCIWIGSQAWDRGHEAAHGAPSMCRLARSGWISESWADQSHRVSAGHTAPYRHPAMTRPGTRVTPPPRAEGAGPSAVQRICVCVCVL
jgi:hypothetical protein